MVILFEQVDLAFTILFTLELLVNITAHWFKEFVSDYWNLFDAFIILTTLLSFGPAQVSFFKTMRLIRAFRVMRLFAKFESLRQMINALTRSVVPVMNAMMIVLLFHCIFAVLGVNQFSEKDPLHFKTFMKAMLTLFQCATLDNWAGITRGLFPEDGTGDTGAILYFVIWLIIVSYTLFPVVVAVLLDSFWVAAKKEKDDKIAEKMNELASQTEVSSLDPLLNTFMTANSMGDVCKRVQNIFRRLDSDNSGGLSHQELFEGLKKMNFKPSIKLPIEEFDRLTENRRLCNEEGELELKHWEAILLTQLKLYAERQLGQAIPAIGEESEHMASLMFGVQIMLRNQEFHPRDYVKRLEREEREAKMMFDEPSLVATATANESAKSNDHNGHNGGQNASLELRLAVCETECVLYRTCSL